MRPNKTIAHLLFSLGLNGAAAVSFRNRLVNGNFSINQRAAPDEPTVYKPGEFIRDRWRAGPDGCTAALKIASNGDATVHIGAGSLLQIVEGSIYLPEGGTYCLAWKGTALGRVLAPGVPPVFASGSVVVESLVGGANATVEFSLPDGALPVSLSLAQLEPGRTPTIFERRDDEAIRCRRYFRRIADPALRGVVCPPNLALRSGMALSPVMREPPRATLINSLFVFDGTSTSRAATILAEYNTNESVDLDLMLLSELTSGRPAIFFSGQGGLLDLDAELTN